MKFHTVASGLLALLCLFLVAGGVYGTQWQVVHGRTRSIAIRMACGATPGHILREVTRDALLVSAIGAGVGALLAWLLVCILSLQALSLQAVSRSLVLESTAIALVLLLVTIIVGCYRPTRRAMAIEPAQALRHE